MRNLKALGLALVAVLAMGALTASAASAHVFTSDSESGTTYFTGVDEVQNEFSTPAGTVTCTEVSFKGQAAGTEQSEVTVHPTYNSCTHSILGAVTVETTGCDYLLKGATDGASMATVKVVCESGKAITIKTSIGCDLKISEQSIGSAVSYANKGGGGEPEDITVTNTATGIKYSKVATSFGACFFVGGNGSDGEYKGPVTVRGYEDAAHTEQVNITTS